MTLTTYSIYSGPTMMAKLCTWPDRRQPILWIAGVIAATMFSWSAIAGPTHDEWAAVRQVLLTTDVGDGRDIVIRWTKSPLYWVHIRSDEHRDVVLDVIDRINRILGGTGIQIRATHERSTDFDGLTVVVPRDRFADILSAGGSSIETTFDDLNGLAYISSDPESGEIFTAYALIADHLSDATIKATIAEETLHSMGVANDHSIFPDSVLYADELGGTSNPEFSTFDKKVLKFLYTYLEPGDDEATVRAKFDTHWHTIDVD